MPLAATKHFKAVVKGVDPKRQLSVSGFIDDLEKLLATRTFAEFYQAAYTRAYGSLPSPLSAEEFYQCLKALSGYLKQRKLRPDIVMALSGPALGEILKLHKRTEEKARRQGVELTERPVKSSNFFPFRILKRVVASLVVIIGLPIIFRKLSVDAATPEHANSLSSVGGDNKCATEMISVVGKCLDPNSLTFARSVFEDLGKFDYKNELKQLLKNLDARGLGIEPLYNVAKDKRSFIQHVLANGVGDVLEILVKHDRSVLTRFVSQGKPYPPHVYAAEVGQLVILKSIHPELRRSDFLKEYSGVNVVLAACVSGQVEVVKFLKEVGALDAHLDSKPGHQCISQAVMMASQHQIDIDKLLDTFQELNINIDADHANQALGVSAPATFYSLLIIGPDARKNFLETLYRHNANPNAKSSTGYPLIVELVQRNFYQEVELLIEHGAHMEEGFLRAFEKKKNPHVFTLRIDEKEEIFICNKKNWYELFKRHKYPVNNRVGPEGLQALHIMTFWENEDLTPYIDDLLKRGAKLNGKNNRGQTPLAYALEQGNEHLCRILLSKKGVEVNKEMQNATLAKKKPEIAKLISQRLQDATLPPPPESAPVKLEAGVTPTETASVPTTISQNSPVAKIMAVGTAVGAILAVGINWGLTKYQQRQQRKQKEQQQSQQKILQKKLEDDADEIISSFEPIVKLECVADAKSNSLSVYLVDNNVKNSNISIRLGGKNKKLSKFFLLECIVFILKQALEKTYCEKVNAEALKEADRGKRCIRLERIIKNARFSKIGLEDLEKILKEKLEENDTPREGVQRPIASRKVQDLLSVQDEGWGLGLGLEQKDTPIHIPSLIASKHGESKRSTKNSSAPQSKVSKVFAHPDAGDAKQALLPKELSAANKSSISSISRPLPNQSFFSGSDEGVNEAVNFSPNALSSSAPPGGPTLPSADPPPPGGLSFFPNG